MTKRRRTGDARGLDVGNVVASEREARNEASDKSVPSFTKRRTYISYAGSNSCAPRPGAV